MEIPAEAKEMQRKLSKRSAELLDLAAVHPEALRPEDFSTYDLPSMVDLFPYPVQGWPTILAGPKLAEMRRATLGVLRLLAKIPERVFGNDPRRIGCFYGLEDEGFIRLVLREPNGLFTALGRGDFLDTATGFKCMEFNVSARLGGWHLRCYIDQLYYQKPWMKELLTRSSAPAVYVDPLRELFEYVVEQALKSGVSDGRELNVGFILSSPSEVSAGGVYYRDYLRDAYAEFLGRHHSALQGELLLVAYDWLRDDGRRLWFGRKRIHSALEFHGPFTHPMTLRTYKAGGVNLFNGPIGMLMDDKRSLAVLSEHQDSDLFDEEDRALIRRHVPWTRVARAGPTEYQGEKVSLSDFVIARRESLVLKYAMGLAGKSVFVGSYTSPEEWSSVAQRAFENGRWIVQERQLSLPYWYQHGETGIAPHDVVWGTFGFGSRYGGGFLRIQPTGRSGVINSAQGATQGMFLEIEQEEE